MTGYVRHTAHYAIPGNHCTVHGYHWPVPARTVQHHVLPQEYGGPTVAANLVLTCDNGHYAIHAALDALIAKRPPPKVTRRELAIAQKGYAAILATTTKGT